MTNDDKNALDRDETPEAIIDPKDDEEAAEAIEEADNEPTDEPDNEPTDEADDEADDEPAADQTDLSMGDDRNLVSPKLLSIVESLLFVSEKPLKVSHLKKLLGERSTARVNRIMRVLIEQRATTGIVVTEVDRGYQLRTNPDNARWIRHLEEIKPIRMSRAALEVVAVVAYRQPVTRAEVDEIRGVDSGAALKQLLSRDLVRIIGRKEEPGRPFLYGTTHEFLSFFSLGALSELPPLRDVAEMAAAESEDDDREAERASSDSPRPEPEEREPPAEVTPEEIAIDEDEADEFDEGDDEVFDALAEASEAAKGADRVKRSLKKMAARESESTPSSPEAGRMLDSIEQLVASRRSRRTVTTPDEDDETPPPANPEEGTP